MSDKIGDNEYDYGKIYGSKWRQWYPTQPFFNKQQNKEMFPSADPIGELEKRRQQVMNIKNNTSIDPLDKFVIQLKEILFCEPNPCNYGPIQYHCQLDHQCYIDVLNLFGHILLYSMLLCVFFYLFTKIMACCQAIGFILQIVPKFICFVASCLKCITFGLFDRNVIEVVRDHKSNVVSKKTQKQVQIQKRLKKLGLQIKPQILEEEKIMLRIQQILDDHSIISSERNSLTQ